MTKVYEFFADGFEELEAMAPVDILRRGGVEVVTVSVTGSRQVTGSHGVAMVADCLIEACDFGDAAALVLPGGMPGSLTLCRHEGLRAALVAQYERGGIVAAICAAPMVLASVGILRGRRATIYPGMEGHLDGAEYVERQVTVDGNVTTGYGPGAAYDFGYTLLAQLAGEEKAREVKEQMIY